MRDFTIQTYKKLLTTLRQQGFSFLSVDEFVAKSDCKAILLRHDVDALPDNSLEFARIQAGLGIRGTYYFRIVPGSFDEKVIKDIAQLGHEVGYHYEDVSLAARRRQATGDRRQGKKGLGEREKGRRGEDYERCLAGIAIESFKDNLERLRQIVPVRTICMHGSPMSRWDSRLLWKYYDYRDFGIIGEPYFDVDFSEVLYLTDTGRRWDGDSFNIRDKSFNRKDSKDFAMIAKDANPVISPNLAFSPSPPLSLSQSFHSTFDIIQSAEAGTLPDKIMMTFHPQRWSDKPVPWIKELIWQNVKNMGKWVLVKAGER